MKPDPIDELLKQSFEGFAPEAPNVWSGVEQGLGNAAAHTTAAATKVGMALGTKLVIAVSTVAVLVAAGLAYRYLQTDAGTLANAPVVNGQSITAPAEGRQEASLPATPPISFTPSQQESSSAGPSKRARQISKAGTEHAASAPSMQAATPNPETRMPDEGRNPVAPASEADKSSPTPPATRAAEPARSNPAKETREDHLAEAAAKDPFTESEQNFYKPEIPNVFTPNNDGINDRFVIGIENETAYHLLIRDSRSGAVVFESFDKAKTWDGTNMSNGNTCEAGYYAYVLLYKLKGSEREYSRKDLIKLIR